MTSLALSPCYDSGGTLFAGAGYNGLYRSTDGGATWAGSNGVFTSLPVEAVVFSPGFSADHTVFAGASNKV